MPQIKACVFDAYGTLFDVNAAAREVANHPDRAGFSAVWQQVARDWRLKTLQYTWLRTISDEHADFWQITKDALDWALEAARQEDAQLREELLGLFWSLKAYNEVVDVLANLQTRGIRSAILSNGTKEMLQAAVDSAGISEMLEHTLSVDDLKVFKPMRAVYDLVGAAMNVSADEVLFVSSNGWDVAGAASYGFRTIWVNRAGEPVDRLDGKPLEIASDLTAVTRMVGV